MERTTLNLSALKIVAERYGFTSYYIKTILWGTRTPKFADQIKKEYHDTVQQLEKLSEKATLKPIQ